MLALAFAHLGLALVLRTTFPADEQVGRFMQLTPGGDYISWVADILALRSVQLSVLAVCTGVALRAKHYTLAVTIALVVLALGLNEPLKQFVARERPNESELAIRVHAPGYAFPSGHTSAAVLVYGTLIFVAWSQFRSVAWRRGVIIASAVAIGLIAWQRPYLGAHWPSDVVGAVFIAGSMLGCCAAAPELVWHWSKKAWSPAQT